MDSLRGVPSDFFTDVEFNGKIDTAMFLRRNGRVLAAWARTPVSWEVVSIMAATTLGSLETMLETLRCPSPQFVSIVAGGNRMFIQKAEPQAILVLIAKDYIPEIHLRDVARRLLAKLPPPKGASKVVPLGPNLREPRGVNR